MLSGIFVIWPDLIKVLINLVQGQMHFKQYLLKREGLGVFIKIDYMDLLRDCSRAYWVLGPEWVEQPTGAL